VDRDGAAVWRAVYEIPGAGDRVAAPYEVGVESRECPVALITAESLELIDQFTRARRVREATGGVLYGSDSTEWPARWFDAVDLIQAEIEREERACRAAVRPE
jgi:hypothetical protein